MALHSKGTPMSNDLCIADYSINLFFDILDAIEDAWSEEDSYMRDLDNTERYPE